ncbi:TetR/AcrR family transcriptional regulator [Dactylosporangium sp. NPDC049525]|uniref:TetR/AcrR family transcriptional regulator n=1 Tax=Dactylosporangium sp. NPDC049525 TaxID=3154730 RepID=UPI00343527AA
MPRVTAEYRASRRAELIAAATSLFAREGFHSTSMADITSESGWSSGAVYRYFRSKEELIGAVADTVLSGADEVFTRLLADGAAPSPARTVTAMVNGIVDQKLRALSPGLDPTRLAVQVWSEALRNPELSERTDQAYRRLRAHCAEVARRWQAAGRLPANAQPEHVGAVMLGVVQGFLLQHLLVRDTTTAGYLGGVDALFPSDTPASVAHLLNGSTTGH